MNVIAKKFLLVGDKLMTTGFMYSAGGRFTKNKKKNKKIQRNRRFKIYLS